MYIYLKKNRKTHFLMQQNLYYIVFPYLLTFFDFVKVILFGRLLMNVCCFSYCKLSLLTEHVCMCMTDKPFLSDRIRVNKNDD